MTDWDTPPREKEGGRVVLVMLLGLALLFGGAYAAAYVLAGDRVPRGTTVQGVEIGGRHPAAAVRALQAGLADRVDRPITVTVDGAAQPVSPQEAGLSVDYAATVAAAGGGQELVAGAAVALLHRVGRTSRRSSSVDDGRHGPRRWASLTAGVRRAHPGRRGRVRRVPGEVACSRLGPVRGGPGCRHPTRWRTAYLWVEARPRSPCRS